MTVRAILRTNIGICGKKERKKLLMQVRGLLNPLLDDDFHTRNRALDQVVARVNSDAIRADAFRGSSHVWEMRRIYEEDIAIRKESFLSIVKRCLPQLRD